jgi:hypothetical protein
MFSAHLEQQDTLLNSKDRLWSFFIITLCIIVGVAPSRGEGLLCLFIPPFSAAVGLFRSIVSALPTTAV